MYKKLQRTHPKIGYDAFRMVRGFRSAKLCRVGLGVLNSANPLVGKYLNPPIKNWDGLQTGYIKPLIK